MALPAGDGCLNNNMTVGPNASLIADGSVICTMTTSQQNSPADHCNNK